MVLWRISNHLDLEGRGGQYFASRWTSRGKRVVYLSESPAGAMLEILVHLNTREERNPRSYKLLEIAAPEGLSSEWILPPVGVLWKENQRLTQKMGDAWLSEMRTPLARVPSAIVPFTWNILLNPLHPDATQVRIASVNDERFDTRLFRLSGSRS